MKLTEARVEFYVDKVKVEFKVIHNLPLVKGMSFMDALNSWLARTKIYTSKSLCKYIMSKDESFVVMTEKQYKNLMK